MMIKWEYSNSSKAQISTNYWGQRRWATKHVPLVTKPDFRRVLQQICFYERGPNVRLVNVKTVKKKLYEAVRVDSCKIPGNVVTMNSLVTIEIMGTDQQFTVKLVFPEFENSREYKISLFSPLGASIFLRKAGDIFTYSTWRKNNTIKILAIPFQPEANGEFSDKIGV